ncbi:uncharacterized protein TRIADDRAFT_56423 [Trichoplax adhaerens]|uniref:Uncharacterized protein n=1 Tax=Trichoplax adhaerens TaxID=10228 RepID=B3RY34_TRIAD|nr:hypothetical protein TRIADDRAFT_56423 [Trichoplax adhaerens]EDV24967.1 hypothetical protein TRIADDRAFT_56423 [Trichoplax adhaerens]|eukprot:XP_002112857.1 hypothetical protein TRIADDRAFT_56423 [Trichoplax adhaerens]
MADDGILDDPNYVETDDGILDDPNYINDDGILDDPDYQIQTSLNDAEVIDNSEYDHFTEAEKEELGIIDDQGILDDPDYVQSINTDSDTHLINHHDSNMTEDDKRQFNKTENNIIGNAITTNISDHDYPIVINTDQVGQLSDSISCSTEIIDTSNTSISYDSHSYQSNQTKEIAELGIIDDDYEIASPNDENTTSSKPDIFVQDLNYSNNDDLDAAPEANKNFATVTSIECNSRSEDLSSHKKPNVDSNDSKSVNQVSFRPKIITRRMSKEDKANTEGIRKNTRNSTRKAGDVKGCNISLTVNDSKLDKSLNRIRSETIVIDKRHNPNVSNDSKYDETTLSAENSLPSNTTKPKRQRSHSDVGENINEVLEDSIEEKRRERRNTLSRSNNISPPRSLKLQKRSLLPSKLPAMKSPTATSPPFNSKPSIKKSSSAVALHNDKNSQQKQSATSTSPITSAASPRDRLKHAASASQLPSRVIKTRVDTSDKKLTPTSNQNHEESTNKENKNIKAKNLSSRHSAQGLTTGNKVSPRISNTSKSLSNSSLLGEKSKRPASASSLTLGRFSRSTTNLSIKSNASKEREDLEKELLKAKAQVTDAKMEASQAIEEAHFLAAKAVEEIKLETDNQIKQAKQQAEQDLLQLKFDADKEIFQLTHLYKDQKRSSQTWQKVAHKKNIANEALAIVIQVLQNKIDALERKVYIEIKDGEEHLSEIDRLKLRQQEQIKRLKESRMIMLKDVNVQHAKKMASLEAKHQISMSELKRAHSKEIVRMECKTNKLQKEHEEQIQHIQNENKESRSILEDESFNLCNEIATLKDRVHELECTSSIDHDQRVQDAVEKCENMPKELESLKAVLELKFQEINRLKTEKQEIASQLLLNNQTKKYIKNLELRNEELEAIVNAKIRTEKKNLSAITILQEELNTLKRERNQLRLEIEQLRWKTKSA